jgi:virginiamycin B lyase
MGRLTTTGAVQFFPLLPNSSVEAIAPGPDGAVWFADVGTEAIGRITTAGVVSEYPAPLNTVSSLTAGPDGALWFTNFFHGGMGLFDNSAIGRMTTSGHVSWYGLQYYFAPTSITAGPDGALWFIESNANAIGRITTSGTITSFALPSISNPLGPSNISRGPDNALWYTTQPGNVIGEITTGGTIRSNAIPSTYGVLGGIASTANGELWLTVSSGAATGVLGFAP